MSKSTRVRWLLLWVLMVMAMVAALLYRWWPQPLPGWDGYKAAFLSSEGRIVDSGNHGVSHSESQGYGMLFAFHAGDRDSFQRLWRWTQENLQTRPDHLFAWRYLPGEGTPDLNNASDGDMLIAWALLLAGDGWGEEEYLKQGRLILDDLRHTVMRQWRGQTLLLPGAYGFEHDGVFTVNLSYWIFPALRDFQRFDPAPEWLALEQSGVHLIRQARFGQWQLPPDWLQLGESLEPAKDREPRYGYDAIRVPLNLVWGGVDDRALLQPFIDFHQAMRQRGGVMPPWVDLTTNGVADYDASAGIKAVYGLLLQQQPPKLGSAGDYYSSSLLMMATLAGD